jgi:hypothetical protein
LRAQPRVTIATVRLAGAVPRGAAPGVWAGRGGAVTGPS